MSLSVLMIGGWGSDISCWDGVAEILAEKGIGMACLCWRDILDDKEAFFERLRNGGEVILAGWSMGGELAIEGALAAPEKVRGLVLISSMARMCSDDGYDGADARALRAMKLKLKKEYEEVLDDFADLCFDNNSAGVLKEKYLMSAKDFNVKELINGLNYLQKTDLRKGLQFLSIPAAILHAEQDNVVPVNCARFMESNIKGSWIKLLESGSHALPFTHPDCCTEVILSLLEDIDFG